MFLHDSVSSAAGRVIACLLLLAVRLAAQTASGEITGTVTDSTGAVVPDVIIKVTHTDTGQVRSAKSGADGNYVLPNLPVGGFSLEASASGFSNYVQTGIILQVGNNVQINGINLLGQQGGGQSASATSVGNLIGW